MINTCLISIKDFNLFWDAYPNKKDQTEAFKRWKKLNGTRPSIEIIVEAIKKQIEWREKANGEFRPEWKNPATWLNKGSWDDELKSGGNGNGTGRSNYTGSAGQIITKTGGAQSDGEPWPADREY